MPTKVVKCALCPRNVHATHTHTYSHLNHHVREKVRTQSLATAARCDIARVSPPLILGAAHIHMGFINTIRTLLLIYSRGTRHFEMVINAESKELKCSATAIAVFDRLVVAIWWLVANIVVDCTKYASVFLCVGHKGIIFHNHFRCCQYFNKNLVSSLPIRSYSFRTSDCRF